MNQIAIEISNLTKAYGAKNVVDHLNLEIEEGELFGFLGENGAGKSTTINMLCTLLAKTDGEAKLGGKVLGSQDDDIRRQIGVVFQDNTLDDLLTVRQNLVMRAKLYHQSPNEVKQNLHRVTELLGLGDILETRYKKLSGGQKRRCEIGRALMNRPSILFLDEPTTGLDPQTRKHVWSMIETMRRESKMTVFLTTHYMEEAAKADHIGIIEQGKLIADATPYELKEQYAHDRLLLVPSDREKVLELLREKHLEVHEKPSYLSVHIKDCLQSIPLLSQMNGMIESFEVLKGSMDDVFLNITGKALKE